MISILEKEKKLDKTLCKVIQVKYEYRLYIIEFYWKYLTAKHVNLKSVHLNGQFLIYESKTSHSLWHKICSFIHSNAVTDNVLALHSQESYENIITLYRNYMASKV